MKKLTIFLALAILQSSCTVQAQPNEGFQLKFGVGYRITPINLRSQAGLSSIPIVPVYYERDKQLAGLAINLGGFYLLQKSKLAFSISSSFRYDHIYFKDSPMGTAKEEKRGVISDVHLSITKFISLKKNQLFVGLGYSFMNNGTTYVYSEEYVTPSGDTLVIHSNSDFEYKSFDLLIGYQVNQLSIELLNRFTMSHKFNDKGQLLLPEIKIAYTIPLKKREIL